MRVFLTGSTGQLGAAVLAELRGARHDVVAPTRRDLDLIDGRAIRSAVDAARPDAVINCAAFTDVDAAEDDAVGALQTNAIAVRALADAAAAADARLVHFSTDFVFDGTKPTPYEETDPPNPQSTYAISKLLGEWLAQTAPRHYVLRVESLFGGPAVIASPRRSSVDRIIDAIAEGREARVFTDRIVSPSHAVDVAWATRALVERDAPFGVYHSVNSGCASWFDVAAECRRILGRGTLVPVSVHDVALRAARPVQAALSNRKLAAAGIVMPSWEDAIGRCLAERFPEFARR